VRVRIEDATGPVSPSDVLVIVNGEEFAWVLPVSPPPADGDALLLRVGTERSPCLTSVRALDASHGELRVDVRYRAASSTRRAVLRVLDARGDVSVREAFSALPPPQEPGGPPSISEPPALGTEWQAAAGGALAGGLLLGVGSFYVAGPSLSFIEGALPHGLPYDPTALWLAAVVGSGLVGAGAGAFAGYFLGDSDDVRDRALASHPERVSLWEEKSRRWSHYVRLRDRLVTPATAGPPVPPDWSQPPPPEAERTRTTFARDNATLVAAACGDASDWRCDEEPERLSSINIAVDTWQLGTHGGVQFTPQWTGERPGEGCVDTVVLETSMGSWLVVDDATARIGDGTPRSLGAWPQRSRDPAVTRVALHARSGDPCLLRDDDGPHQALRVTVPSTEPTGPIELVVRRRLHSPAEREAVAELIAPRPRPYPEEVEPGWLPVFWTPILAVPGGLVGVVAGPIIMALAGGALGFAVGLVVLPGSHDWGYGPAVCAGALAWIFGVCSVGPGFTAGVAGGGAIGHWLDEPARERANARREWKEDVARWHDEQKRRVELNALRASVGLPPFADEPMPH
jgi:hypothetical protein